jgi:hypothetical protein
MDGFTHPNTTHFYDEWQRVKGTGSHKCEAVPWSKHSVNLAAKRKPFLALGFKANSHASL